MTVKRQRIQALKVFFFASMLTLLFQNCSKGGGFQVSHSSLAAELTTEPEDQNSHTVQNPQPSPTSTPTPTATPAPTPTPTPAVVCKPPRHYRYNLAPGQEKFLSCSNQTDLFNVTIPDKGRAIARVSAIYKNNGPHVYFWSTAVVVGAPIAAYAVGDDICPQTPTTLKQTLGYGTLTANASNVRVTSRQGSSPCQDQQVVVWSGAYLDVWVEDDQAECVGKDLSYSSVYMTRGVSEANVYIWKTHMEAAVNLSVKKAANRTQIRTLTSAEGTPDLNPNRICGQEAASLVTQSVVGGKVTATAQEVIPASQGMGHLVLSTESVTSTSALGSVFNVGLYLGSNTGVTRVFTGGCCGDGVIATIQHP